MSFDNSRAIYKSRSKDLSSTASRRRSRNLERKSNRDEQLNQRRLLSDDMEMSPVLERSQRDTSTDRDLEQEAETKKQEKVVKHEKAPSRMERLQQWRIERKKQQEEEKKKQKPGFKVTNLMRGSESHLFRKEIVPSKNVVNKASTKKTELPKKALTVQSQPPATKVRQVPEPRTTRSKTVEKKPVGTGKESARLKATKRTEKVEAPRELRQRSKSKMVDLSTKMTAAAAAKMTAAAAAKTKKPYLVRGQGKKEAASSEHKGIVNGSRKAKVQRGQPSKLVESVSSADNDATSSDSQDGLHLGNALMSTPKPHAPAEIEECNKKTGRSGNRRQSRRSVRGKKMQDISTIEKLGSNLLCGFVSSGESASSPANSVDEGRRKSRRSRATPGKALRLHGGESEEELNVSASTNKENRIDSPVKVERSSENKRLTRRSVALMGTSSVSSATTSEDDKEVRNKVESMNKASVSRRKSSRRVVTTTENDCSPASQKPRESFLKQKSKEEMILQREDVFIKMMDEAEIDTQTSLDVNAAETPISHQRERMGSALSKRKSRRLAPQSTSTEDSSSEPDCKTMLVRATPRSAKRRHSRRRSSSTRRLKHRRSSSSVRRSRRSTVVSVSDEGTGMLIGKDVVAIIDANNHIVPSPKVEVNTASHRSRRSLATPTQTRSARRSTVVSVSDEGTSIAEGDTDKAVAYQVGKPADAPAESRALQELAVEKVEGEISYIEVPLDESMKTPKEKLPLFLPKSSEAEDKEEQSTQPFTPSSSSPVATTPKSSRRRGQSMTPASFFKEPGEPLSALRKRGSAKRRKTEYSGPSRSPEEMIEILKNSPMVEMTRRKSRHISSPASIMSVEPTHTDVLFASTSPLKRGNVSAPEVLEFDLGEVKHNGNMSTSSSGAECEPMETEEVASEASLKVKPFRELLVNETARLNKICAEWNGISSYTFGISEEILGQIRCATGKAQLLIDQRFKQFSGLVDDCEFERGEKETTPSDLQGFWEMIYYQVEDVDKLFAELSELRSNNWQEKIPTPKVAVNKKKKLKVAAKPRVKSNFTAFRAEMMKRKALNAKAAAATDDDAQEKEMTKVFDAGFFKVSSPVRSPGTRSTPLKTSPTKSTPLKASPTKSTPVDNAEMNLPEKEVEEASNKSENEADSTPTGKGDKENQRKVFVSTPQNSRVLPVHSRRLSYVPAVPSPLLNDFTGMDIKDK